MSVAAHAGEGAHEHGHLAASYGETPELIERRERLGVLLLIGGDMIFVFCLVFTYLYLRGLNVNGHWLPAGIQTASIAMTWTIAVIAVASALVYVWAAGGMSKGLTSRLRAGTGIALLLLLADLVLQIVQIATIPFRATSGAYASSFLVMAGYHVVHLVVAIFVGLAILSRAGRGLFRPDHHGQVRLAAYFWVWVGISAVLFAVCLLFTAPLGAAANVS